MRATLFLRHFRALNRCQHTKPVKAELAGCGLHTSIIVLTEPPHSRHRTFSISDSLNLIAQVEKKGRCRNLNTPSILRICVSKAKSVNWNGHEIATGIFKLPVEGKVLARKLNLEGDEQADLSVHGGPDKAVYAYPIEQYAFWSSELPERNFEWGSFGENFTTAGLDEHSVCIGDRLKIGTAHFVVTQPRMPCFKLGIRLSDPSMVRRFFKSGKWGFYLAVTKEGEVETGDQIILDGSDEHRITLADVAECFIRPDVESKLVSRVLNSNLAAQMKEQLEYQNAKNRG